MEPVIDLKCSLPAEFTSLSPTALIWQDVLAQAMTGELLAAMNYTSLSEICDDPEEVADALEHAAGEKGHAAAFAAEGRRIGVDVSNNVNAKHWKRLREAFLRCIAERDFIGCLIVQEIMLESFAVASYARVGKVAPGSLGKTFAAIAAEEEDHIEPRDGNSPEQSEPLDAQRFDDKLYRLHLEVMTTLAEMLARDCRTGHCEVCHGSCVKPALPDVSLSAAELRGASLHQYLKTLDKLGLPGEVTLDMGELNCQSSRSRFRPDRSSGKLASGCGRTRSPARTRAYAAAGRRDPGHPALDSAPGRLSRRNRIRHAARRRAVFTSTPSFLPTVSTDAYHARQPARVRGAAACAIKAGAKIVSLGGFSSILIEGNFNQLPERHGTVFTTGNTLTVGFIVQGIRKMCALEGRNLRRSTLLIVGRNRRCRVPAAPVVWRLA